MNGISSGQHEDSTRGQIRDEALEWFARAQMGPLAPDAERQFEVWLAQSYSHCAAYWRLEGAWEEAERLVALRPAKRGIRPTVHLIASSSTKIVAAAVVLVLVAVAFQFQLVSPDTKAYATGVGGRKILSLADGSKIELNTSTSIRVSANGASRTVWLDKGEAYFQIVHNAVHPFVVIAGNRRIIDLGTKFVAHQTSGKLEVSLIEGRARVEITDNPAVQSANLVPGDVAVASVSAISVARKSTDTMNSQLSWRRGVLVFKGATLADATAEMNRYNTEKLVVRDPVLARQTIDGTFPIHAVGQFTEMAQAVFGLRAEKRGTDTVMTR